jgi:hypothetical protein
MATAAAGYGTDQYSGYNTSDQYALRHDNSI